MQQSQLRSETIERRARPARVAVLIDASDSDWANTALRVIEFLSSIWGGQNSLIVPTDGKSIQPPFWDALEKFSPDYVFYFAKTLNDLQLAQPSEYSRNLLKNARSV